MDIAGYTEILTTAQMDELLKRMSNFHDSLAKELHLVNRGYVEEGAGMMTSHRFDARLLIQSQWRVRAIELLFIDVDSLTTGDPAQYWGASGTITTKSVPTERRRVEMSFDGRLTLSASRLFVRDRVDAYGARTRFGEEIPHPDLVRATALVAEWRQCSACAEGFEAPPAAVHVLCPGCGAMTELVGE